MDPIRIVHTDAAPRVNGHYSQALAYGGTVYVSGQLGRGPGMSDAEAGDFVAQTCRALAALAAILEAAGSDLSLLLKVNIHIAAIGLWPAVNKEYERALGSHRPARAVVPASLLHFGARIEIDGIVSTRELTGGTREQHS